jgi:hypothetical protein
LFGSKRQSSLAQTTQPWIGVRWPTLGKQPQRDVAAFATKRLWPNPPLDLETGAYAS